MSTELELFPRIPNQTGWDGLMRAIRNQQQQRPMKKKPHRIEFEEAPAST